MAKAINKGIRVSFDSSTAPVIATPYTPIGKRIIKNNPKILNGILNGGGEGKVSESTNYPQK